MNGHRAVWVVVAVWGCLGTVCISWADRGVQPVQHREVSPAGMSLAQAAVLGLVEGVTEYLPVSSTGHLLVAQRMMGIGGTSVSDRGESGAKTAADAYAICIQAGAILAVLGLYAARVKQMVLGLMGKDPLGLRMVVNLFAGFAPAAVSGLILADRIQAVLFGPWPVIAAWFAGGMGILAVAWWTKGRRRVPSDGMTLDELTWKAALGIGVAQCVAMWPGVSRSLMTIVGGVLLGLSVPAAVEFSFLLGVVTLGAATVYEALKHGHVMVQIFDPGVLAVGLMVAFVSAAVAVKWMVAYLNRHGLAIFGYYRVVLAAGTALLLTTKAL